METAILLEEQKGLWIDSRLLKKAGLGDQFEVVVGEGEILIKAVDRVVSSRSAYDSSANNLQHVLREARQEVLLLYGNQAPPADQPYFGGGTWQTYRQLSEAERTALWNRIYQEFDIAIDDVEEKVVRPNALVAG